MPKYTENKKASNRRWDVANLDRLSIAAPKGEGDTIKAAAAGAGQSVNAYILEAVRWRMEGSGAEVPTDSADNAGGVLTLDALKTASEAALKTGETLSDFLARAIATQASRDSASLRMGFNPATERKVTPGADKSS